MMQVPATKVLRALQWYRPAGSIQWARCWKSTEYWSSDGARSTRSTVLPGPRSGCGCQRERMRGRPLGPEYATTMFSRTFAVLRPTPAAIAAPPPAWANPVIVIHQKAAELHDGFGFLAEQAVDLICFGQTVQPEVPAICLVDASTISNRDFVALVTPPHPSRLRAQRRQRPAMYKDVGVIQLAFWLRLGVSESG